MSSMSMNGLTPRVRHPRPMDANLYVSRLSPTRFRRLFLASFPYVPTFCLQFKKVVTPGRVYSPLCLSGLLLGIEPSVFKPNWDFKMLDDAPEVGGAPR